MKVWGVYDDEIRELANEVGLRILGEWDHVPAIHERLEALRERYPSWDPTGIRREGKGYRFRLALRERLPTGELKFQKIGYDGRRTSGVCWHGYREFLMALFRKFPEARVQTALGDFRGRDNFLQNYRRTRDRRSFNFTMATRCVCQPRRIPLVGTPAGHRWSEYLRHSILTSSDSTNFNWYVVEDQ